MNRITEKDYPYLKDLMWEGKIFDNPTFRKAVRRAYLRHGAESLCTDWLIGIDASDDGRNDAEMLLVRLSDSWPKIVRAFKSGVSIVSKDFLTAVMECHDAFVRGKDASFQYLAGKTFSGTLLIPSFGMTISYSIPFDENGAAVANKSVFLELDRHGSVIVYKEGLDFVFVSRSFELVKIDTGEKRPFDTLVDRTCAALDYINDFVVDYILFCRFAEVKTKIIPRDGSREARRLAGSPDAEVSMCQLPIRRMYADYYTTIVREEGFGVKGHFRMQPFGKGRQDRRLVYIKPFEKHGYVRKAKKSV